MSDIIITDYDALFDIYRQLLLQKDNLDKECVQLLLWHEREFGELLVELYKKQVDCIAKKKAITFCQKARNVGKAVNIEDLNDYLEDTMEEYNRHLDEMVKKHNYAKSLQTCDEYTESLCKKAYRRIAKLIHPDINPNAWEIEEIPDLWERTQIAYELNNLDELRMIETLVSVVLSDNGFDVSKIKIDNIEEKIEKLEYEIKIIRSTKPYTYRDLQDNPQKAEEKKQSLREKIEAYKKYENDLAEMLTGFIGRGVIVSWRK